MGMQFHSDKERYFEMQRENAATYVIPFIEQAIEVKAGMSVLEIGCAEGGVLLAFLEKGCQGVGVELSAPRVETAEGFLADYIAKGQARIINKNIYDPSFEEEFSGQFDLIVLKDVIEHIPDQLKVMGKMKTFLKPGGHIYFGFPPWMMPFGGHQQIARTKIAKLPYLHLFPRGMYRWFLRRFGESEQTITELIEIWDTGISLERFERVSRKTGYTFAAKTLYLINPIYRYKFKLKPRKQAGFIGAIPWFRNFVTTCGYYLLKADN